MKHWDDIHHFLAIVRGGTLQAAATELGVDQSTVFRRLRALETYLGTHVFDRRHRGRYELTQAGETLVVQAQRIEDAMHDIEHRVRGKDLQLSGRIRVATAEDMAVSLLPSYLRAFEREHPEISIEILTANRYFSLARNEADVAIRPGYSTDEERIFTRRICRTCMGFYASADYLARYGKPRSHEDLADHNVIEWREDLARDNFFGEFSDWFGNARQHGSNSLLSIRAMAVEGLGMALLPEFLGADDNRLQRVLPEVRIDSGYIWLLHHSEMRHNARIRAFTDFIYTALRADPRITPADQSDLYTPRQGPLVDRQSAS
jgi:DNA-binding transcriptional LysR family regulator